MKKHNVAKNYLFNMSYQALLALVPLITQPYIARTIGSTGIGEYSYTQSIVTYYILLGSLGINVYGQREIAFVQDDDYKRSKVFRELLIIKASMVSISILIFYLLIVRNSDNKLLYYIQTLDIVAAALDITWFFQGMEEFKKIAIRNCIVKAAGVIFIFIFVKGLSDLPIYILCFSSMLIVGNLSLWLYLPQYITKVSFSELIFKSHIKGTVWMFIPQIASSVYTVLDKTMIGMIVNVSSEVGYYDYAQKIVNLLLTVITSMGNVMFPRVANLFASGERKKLQKALANSYDFAFILAAPMIVGIEVISNRFSIIFWGNQFAKAGSLMQILCFIILFVGLSNVTGLQFLVPTGHEKAFTVSIIIGAATNVVLNIILISRYGTYGACISSVIAESIVLTIQLFFAKKELDFKNLFQGVWKYILASIVMGFLLKVIPFIGSDFIIMISQILVGMCLYLVILFLFKERHLCLFVKKNITQKNNRL